MLISESRKSLFFLFGICLVATGIYLWGRVKLNTLKKSHLKTIGLAKRAYYTGGRNGPMNNIAYSFAIGDKIINNVKAIHVGDVSLSGCEQLVGKSFPVKYNPNNPSISYMVIFPGDFNFFNEPYPDSLKWVLQYLKK